MKSLPFFQFASTTTDNRYSIHEPRWCGMQQELLDIEADFYLPVEDLKNRPKSLWRYREAIPIASSTPLVSMQEGFTPMLPLVLGQHHLHVKQEQLFPSGSYKDRGATVLMTQARYLQIKSVVQDSSGNAGCAIATYAALARISCTIFLPEETSEAKIVQMKAANACIERVPGSREDTARATWKAAQQTYYASHCWNPFFLHGTKTFAYEVWEQLGYKSPDVLVLPAGNGTLVLGCFIGFQELLRMGLTDKMPKIVGIQAENCAPLVAAYQQNASHAIAVSVQPTLAEGIAIAEPVRGGQMLAAVRQSQGTFLVVSEAEIAQAFLLVAKQGFYIEPTSAATIAGAMKFCNHNSDCGTVVTLFSGHGLKSGDKILKMLK
ncbi:MAG: pyridoxal-phosphate dependent enzyme [Cytophagales bacterium]|nr:MAG: pyridoxal-phosphate dependent enzyme [Cytophagales bacterium]TAF61516.1 MAG: pyridoxal-phosphate dependent enzyme [Cytophagales bacterium]